MKKIVIVGGGAAGLELAIKLGRSIGKKKTVEILLLDKERIVINDKKIIQNPSRHTIKAFEEFELSFLVHASIEKKVDITSHWFNEVGFTSSSLKNTKLVTK